MWRRELGLDVRLANMENNSALDARRTGNYRILRSSGSATTTIRKAFCRLDRRQRQQFTGWADPAYDALKQAELATVRCRASRSCAARRACSDAAPLSPSIIHPRLPAPASSKLAPHLAHHHPYKHVWLEE